MKQPYWIRKYIDYCPVCGGEKTTRERVYGEKPTDGSKRVVVAEVYDWCNEGNLNL